MPGENSTLDILIKTRAELAGAEAAAAALERDIGKAKALGQSYGEQETQLKKANAAINDYKATLPPVTEESEKLKISHRGLHQIFNMLGRETIPEFGHALAGLALYGVVGVFIALGSALMALKNSFDTAAKKASEFWDALDAGNDSHASFLKGQDEVAAALYKTADAAEAFAQKIEDIKNAQAGIKSQADDAVKALQLEAQEVDKLAAAELKAAEARIKQQYATGKITKQQEIAALAAMDDQAGADKLRREQQLAAEVYRTRFNEMEQTKKAAAAAAAATAAAQAEAAQNEVGPLRQKHLIENTRAELAAARERQKQLEAITNDPFWKDPTNRVPWADNYPQYKAAKEELASNADLQDQLQARLKKLDRPEVTHEYEKSKADADAKLRASEAAQENLEKRVKDLEKELADLKREGDIRAKYDPATVAAEKAARDTDAGTQIIEANKADSERKAREQEAAAREAERAAREAGQDNNSRARHNDNEVNHPGGPFSSVPTPPTAGIDAMAAAFNKKWSEHDHYIATLARKMEDLKSINRDNLNA